MTDATLERLVHGVLWPGFRGTTAPGWLRGARDAGLAGAVLFAGNVVDGAPLEPGEGFLVGIDEEGGSVTRAQAAHGATLPSAAQLGVVDDVDATRRAAAHLAALGASVGANVLAHPVADVNVEAANPVIGTRAFGADPELVARHVAAAVRGVASTGLAACAKHFPGHGDTVVDSHHGLPVSAAGPGEQERVHVPPFAAAIAAGAPAIMTAHVVVPTWGERPSTLEPSAIGRLRALGFDGVVATDALDMRAVASLGRGVAAVSALRAGCDLLCLGNPDNPGSPADDGEPLADAAQAIRRAVGDGTLPIARLEEAAHRVASLRAALADVSPPRFDAAAAASLGARIAAAALREVGAWHASAAPRLVLDARAAATWATSRTGLRMAPALAAGGTSVVVDSPAQAATAASGVSDVVVLVDRLADPEQRAICDAVAIAAPHAIAVDLGVAPPDEPPLPVLRTFGTGAAVADVVARRLLA